MILRTTRNVFYCENSYIHLRALYHKPDPPIELRSRETTYKDNGRQKDTMIIAFGYQSSMNQTHVRFERKIYQAALEMNVTNKQIRFLKQIP